MEEKPDPEKSEKPKQQPNHKKLLKSCLGVQFSYYSGFMSGYQAGYRTKVEEIRNGSLN